MKLSDAFEISVDSMELVVKAYNINYSEHREILNKCQVLREYSVFVSKVKEELALGRELGTAVRNAIRYCIENDIMKNYLLRKQEEVSDMVSVEWDMEKAKRNWYEEGLEEGLITTTLAMLKKKCDFDFIAEITKLSKERIEEIARENNLL